MVRVYNYLTLLLRSFDKRLRFLEDLSVRDRRHDINVLSVLRAESEALMQQVITTDDINNEDKRGQA